jgi:hypothetical protein
MSTPSESEGSWVQDLCCHPSCEDYLKGWPVSMGKCLKLISFRLHGHFDT